MNTAPAIKRGALWWTQSPATPYSDRRAVRGRMLSRRSQGLVNLETPGFYAIGRSIGKSSEVCRARGPSSLSSASYTERSKIAGRISA
jgi:hypothetical protein